MWEKKALWLVLTLVLAIGLMSAASHKSTADETKGKGECSSIISREETESAKETSDCKNDLDLLARSSNQFAFDLYSRISSRDGNVFFSPNSISIALAMTYAGACGTTAEQIATVLHFGELKRKKVHDAYKVLLNKLHKDRKGYELNIANALWAHKDYSFLNNFLDLIHKNYSAALREVNFVKQTEKSRKDINNWVAQQTKDRIKELVKPGMIDAGTRLVLTNAIYFKGTWLTEFNKEDTTNAEFMLTQKETIEAPLMNLRGKFNYWGNENLQILELPYKYEDLSAIVLLPREVDGITAIERDLSAKNLKEWTAKMDYRQVTIFLPRFKIIWGVVDLKEILRDLGIKAAFLPEADFSGMTGNRDLFISKVLHKAFVQINEEGTEAAAATAVTMIKSLKKPLVFRADHPFVFLIKDKRTDCILFIGKVVNPVS